MKNRLLVMFCLMVLTAAAVMANTIRDRSRLPVARGHLSGDQEVPPVDTRAQGQALVYHNDDGTIGFKLNVANIRNITQAHIHCAPEGTNGQVVAFLFGFVSGGVTVNGILAEGTISDDDVIPRAGSAACPGGVSNLSDLLFQISQGNAYVNVHTTQNPPGEVRGQLSPQM